jgi:hypothetical protein
VNKSLTLFIVAAVMFVGVGQVAADVTVYTSRPAFEGDAGVLTVEDFTSSSHAPISSGVLNHFTTDAGLSVGDIALGVTFTVEGNSTFPLPFNIDSGGGFTGGLLDGLHWSGENQILVITFDGVVGEFGFDTNHLMSTFDIVISRP